MEKGRRRAAQQLISDRCKNLTPAAFLWEARRFHLKGVGPDSISWRCNQQRMPSRGRRFPGEHPMQSVQPDHANPIPLRQTTHGMGTLMFRFVGLLTVAVVLMTMIWNQ
jgi:hypothetical protein